MPTGRMYCEIYRCHMSVAACIQRQENARKWRNTSWGPGHAKPGALDINCQNCEQGRRLVAAYGSEGKEIMEKDIKNERPTSNIERPMMNEKDKDEMETQICKEPDCEAGGSPQPIGNFQIHGPSGKPLGICKACMGKKLKKGKQEKKKRDERPTSKEKPVSASFKADASVPLPPAPRDLQTRQYYPHDMLDTLLDGLPEILKTIKEMAHDQERTPIAQVRYLLKTDYRITGADAENE